MQSKKEEDQILKMTQPSPKNSKGGNHINKTDNFQVFFTIERGTIMPPFPLPLSANVTHFLLFDDRKTRFVKKSYSLD